MGCAGALIKSRGCATIADAGQWRKLCTTTHLNILHGLIEHDVNSRGYFRPE
jgi:hypothetical protein